MDFAKVTAKVPVVAVAVAVTVTRANTSPSSFSKRRKNKKSGRNCSSSLSRNTRIIERLTLPLLSVGQTDKDP